MKKNILITGDKGFIGNSVESRLSASGHSIFGLSDFLSDVRDLGRKAEALSKIPVEHVIHLAAKVGVKKSWEDPVEYYSVNVHGTQQVLEFCRQRDASLTYLSAFVYDPENCGPFTEDAEVKPSSPYNHSKWLGEELCRFYQEKFNLSCTILRPFNLFGIRQKREFLIPEIVHQVESSSERVELRGLSPIRDYLFIEDLMSLIEMVVDTPSVGTVFNVGTGKGHSVEEVAGIVQKIWGTNKPVCDVGGVRLFEVDSAVADITKAKSRLGWGPRYTLEDGLRAIHQHRSADYASAGRN